MLGATWLRAGEVENCLLMPNADRCLFPVLPGGVHVKQEGAKNAAAIFTEYLASNPDDLEVRWLLNLSYMLLGTYPQEQDVGGRDRTLVVDQHLVRRHDGHAAPAEERRAEHLHGGGRHAAARTLAPERRDRERVVARALRELPRLRLALGLHRLPRRQWARPRTGFRERDSDIDGGTAVDPR
jgi:hypothetical protein